MLCTLIGAVILSIYSPTLVANWYIDGKVFTSSYYTMETQKFDFFFLNFKILISTCAEELRQYQSYIGNWYINGNGFTSSYCSMET